MAQLRMKFSLSRKWYQIFPSLLIHCAPSSNFMCRAGDSAYQCLVWIVLKFEYIYPCPCSIKLEFCFLLQILFISSDNQHGTKTKSSFGLISDFCHQALPCSWYIHWLTCGCWFFSFCADSNLQNHIALYYTASMYNNFNNGFGTVKVGGKFENCVRRLCSPQVYKYPLASCKKNLLQNPFIKNLGGT